MTISSEDLVAISDLKDGYPWFNYSDNAKGVTTAAKFHPPSLPNPTGKPLRR